MFFYTKYFNPLQVYKKFEDSGSVMKTFIGEKEKWTNNGNYKHEDADSVLHIITSHTKC